MKVSMYFSQLSITLQLLKSKKNLNNVEIILHCFELW